MTAYYNEIDPFAAEWLRELIKAGAIAPGTVDERSIEDVRPSDLRGFTQCHFFAGVGVWSYALRQSGWSDDRPVWSGSCPCQPFSAAGKGAGFADERHLWPAFFHLIEQCRPAIVFGEQVASKAVEPWIDLVQADLEAVGYAFGCVPFPSASVGAPHIRDRAYWVADSGLLRQKKRSEQAKRGKQCSSINRLADMHDDGCNQGRECVTTSWDDGAVGNGAVGRVGNARHNNDASQSGSTSDRKSESIGPADKSGRSSDSFGWMANSSREGLETRIGEPSVETESVQPKRYGDCIRRPRPTNGFWRDVDWLFCRDGKWRPVEPGTFPLVNGAAKRVVCACTECETETVIYEGMYFLRKIVDRNKGRFEEKILRQRVLSFARAINAVNQQKHGTLQSERTEAEGMRNMPFNIEATCSSQGQKPIERPSGEPANFMLEMPSQNTLHESAIYVRSVWKDIQSGIAPKQEQNMFCPVCERVGAHICTEEVSKNRVGRLRGYGNAINAEAAKAFITAFMEGEGDG